MLYENGIIDNTYQIISEIGSGGMGVVYLAYHIRLEKYVVLKKFKGQHHNISLLRNEVDILKKLHHSYLPQVYDFINHNNDIYTVIDYIDGNDLEYYIKNGYTFTESQLIKWLKQLCEVLKYLHSQSPAIIHTDIKPANIIVTADGNICLIDFGISLSEYDTVKGYSKNYSSPEQYENVLRISNGYKEQMVQLDARTDIYSLGATFYNLMSGYKPDVENLYQYQLSQLCVPYSEAFVSIIDKSMARNRDERFQNIGKMYNALSNMIKLDVRYKKYVVLQILTSVIAGILILSGIGMMVFGNNQQILDDYNSSYNKFLDYYESGDYSAAVDEGNEILKNKRYEIVCDEETKAQILCAMGECFYECDDFSNAAKYYEYALENIEYVDNPEIYYRDYAIALIKNNDFETAKKVLAEAGEKYPESPIIQIISAEMNYQQGNYEETIRILENCMNQSLDLQNQYKAYILYGDACNKLEKYDEAISAYNFANETNQNDVVVWRRLGRTYLAIANNTTTIDMVSLTNAKECYQQIYDKYFPLVEDGINLSQIYMLMEDYSSAKKTLEELTKTYPNDYRVYMQLAFACSKNEDAQTAFYCEEAKKLYQSATEKDRKNIDSGYIESFKELYRKYCNKEW